MSTSVPDAVREGTAAASRLHNRLKSRSSLGDLPSRIDVLAAASQLKIVLLFRPLKGLLGAYLPLPRPGILVTTERPLPIQRFTAAHEIGHAYMQHSPSVDDEQILRRGIVNLARPSADNFQEVEANAFAASFLMPQWLIAAHCRHQGWIGTELQRPENLYQLSLRLGVSFEALCWTMQRYNLLPANVVDALDKIEPVQLKKAVLGSLQPPDFRRDVWLLTEKDAGSTLYASPHDYFVLKLKEHASSGYLWDFSELERSGFLILRNDSMCLDDETIGGASERRVTAGAVAEIASRRSARLQEVRPWIKNEPIAQLTLDFDFQGSEKPGFSSAERRRLFGAN